MFCVGDPRPAYAGAECRGTGNQYGNQVGHGSATHEQAAGGEREAEQFPHPLHDLPFHFYWYLIASAEIGIQAGGEHLGQHAHGCAAAMHPAHETGMRVADSEGQNLAHERVMHGRQIGRFRGQRLLESAARRRRYRLPDRSFT